MPGTCLFSTIFFLRPRISRRRHAETDKVKLRIGFLGFGKMATSIAEGLRRSHPVAQLFAYDPIPSAHLPEVKRVVDPAELENNSDVIVLCTKPQDLGSAVTALKGSRMYISIAAGLSLDTIRGFFSAKNVRLARVMPNLPATIQAGVTASYSDDTELRTITKEIFESVGAVVELGKEDLLHAVTGLSGSGPGFVFAFIQALAEGGVLAGLPYADALLLAAGTVSGSAQMVAQGLGHPGVLRNQVTSAGGTTIAGLLSLEENAFHSAVMKAVKAATARSRELGAR